MSDGNEFAVWLYFPDGTHMLERAHLPAKEAVELAKQCTERPAAALGMIRKVQIVDGDDFTVFMWEHGKGVTYPTQAEREARKMNDLNFCDHCSRPFEPGHGFDDFCSEDCADEARAVEWACDELEGEPA